MIGNVHNKLYSNTASEHMKLMSDPLIKEIIKLGIQASCKTEIFDFSIPAQLQAYNELTTTMAQGEKLLPRFEDGHWTQDGRHIRCVSYIILEKSPWSQK